MSDCLTAVFPKKSTAVLQYDRFLKFFEIHQNFFIFCVEKINKTIYNDRKKYLLFTILKFIDGKMENLNERH